MTWLFGPRQTQTVDDERKVAVAKQLVATESVKGAVAEQRRATDRVKVAAVQSTMQADNVRETLAGLLDEIEKRRFGS